MQRFFKVMKNVNDFFKVVKKIQLTWKKDLVKDALKGR
jgi:hypothetical protein